MKTYKTISCRCEKELYDAVNEAARADHRTASNWVRMHLEKILDCYAEHGTLDCVRPSPSADGSAAHRAKRKTA